MSTFFMLKRLWRFLMKYHDISLFEIGEETCKTIDTSGYEYVLHALSVAPYFYQIKELQHRNDWSLRIHVKKDDQDFLLVLIDPNLYTLQQISFLQKRELRLAKIACKKHCIIPIDSVYDERISFIRYPYISIQPFSEYLEKIQTEVIDWIPQVLQCIQQLSQVLSTLHQNLHFHLGLSWQNLYVDSDNQLQLLGFGMGARFTDQAREWLPPEINIGYPQSEVGDFFAIGKLLQIICEQIPIFEQEKYGYLEDVQHRLIEDNPNHRLQSHEELQRLLEPSRYFRFYRHWNIDICNENSDRTLEIHHGFCFMNNQILPCNASFLYQQGLSLPSLHIFEGKLLLTSDPILWNLLYIFDEDFQKTVDPAIYGQFVESLSPNEQIFISWLHRVKANKKDLPIFATILDSYANISNMWAHIIDYFQRQWPEYRCMFVQCNKKEQIDNNIHDLCILPTFQQIHTNQKTLQSCIDQAFSLEEYLNLAMYFLIFSLDDNKSKKLFVQGIWTVFPQAPTAIKNAILATFSGQVIGIQSKESEREFHLKNKLEDVLKIIHFAMILDLPYLSDFLLETLYSELDGDTITNKLKYVQKIANSLDKHPFIAHACLHLESRVVTKDDIDTLISILQQIGLEKRIEPLKKQYYIRMERIILELKMLALQNNIDISDVDTKQNLENLHIIIRDLKQKIQNE